MGQRGAGISQTKVAESLPAGFGGGEKARHCVLVARRLDSSAPRLTPTAAFALALNDIAEGLQRTARGRAGPQGRSVEGRAAKTQRITSTTFITSGPSPPTTTSTVTIFSDRFTSTLAVDSVGTNPRFDGSASLQSALGQSALPRSTR